MLFLKLYRLFIPIKYNNGTDIEPEKLLKISEEIRKKFGVYTAVPTVMPTYSGIWTDENDKSYKDEIICYEILVDDTEDNTKWFKSFSEITRQELKQKSIFLLCQYAEVIKFDS